MQARVWEDYGLTYGTAVEFRVENYDVVDGMKQSIHTGDVITMATGCRHTVSAITELRLIEVQLGKEISVADKKKYHE